MWLDKKPGGLLSADLPAYGVVQGLLEVVFLYVLEVSVGVYLEFSGSKFVTYDDTMLMGLKGRKGACL